MNTQGWLRGLISYNSPLEKYVDFVLNTISKEFMLKIEVIDNGVDFLFCIGHYKLNITKEELISLQKRSPYALDKYILESLKHMGFKFDCHRSQYIECCYGLIVIE